MRSDMVIVRAELLEKFRKANRVSYFGLFSILRVNPLTGNRLMGGIAVSVRTAERVATAIGAEVENLIERWVNEGETGTA